jgi:hypothetical protein
MVFNEWFGELTDAQWRAYRRPNISPSDHDSRADTGCDGEMLAGWVNTLRGLGCAPNCIYGPAWAQIWERAGYNAPRCSLARRGDSPSLLRSASTDAPLAGVHRQPSLFEHDAAPRSAQLSIEAT